MATLGIFDTSTNDPRISKVTSHTRPLNPQQWTSDAIISPALRKILCASEYQTVSMVPRSIKNESFSGDCVFPFVLAKSQWPGKHQEVPRNVCAWSMFVSKKNETKFTVNATTPFAPLSHAMFSQLRSPYHFLLLLLWHLWDVLGFRGGGGCCGCCCEASSQGLLVHLAIWSSKTQPEYGFVAGFIKWTRWLAIR